MESQWGVVTQAKQACAILSHWFKNCELTAVLSTKIPNTIVYHINEEKIAYGPQSVFHISMFCILQMRTSFLYLVVHKTTAELFAILIKTKSRTICMVWLFLKIPQAAQMPRSSAVLKTHCGNGFIFRQKALCTCRDRKNLQKCPEGKLD